MQSLKSYNTFQMDVNALALTEVRSASQLKKLLQTIQLPHYMLGGGSNILFTKDVHAHIIINRIDGIKKVNETRDFVFVEVGGGVVWHDFVLWALEENLGGIENLSLIPGCIGAAPIQNIGAYGVELKDTFVDLKAMSKRTLKLETFNNKECAFGYRDSIFKQEAKGQFYICSVTFKLRKKPKLNIQYGAINTALEELEIKQPSIQDVSNAIINIRQSKLPDPAHIGNAGSFFKNPIVDYTLFNQIQKSFPKIPHYVVNEKQIKIPAGWLIEQCGWKGKQIGEVGCYHKQALVIVNHGNATGADVKQHALNIKKSVFQKFSIPLQNEVNIL